jgi:hypothetical protein
MQRLFVLMVGGVLLGMYLSSSITLAEQTTQAFKELQDKYHKALQEIERLQSELDEARCFQADQPLTLYCRQRHLTLKPADAEYYTGTRGRRGASLSRGFQRVDRLCAHGNHHLG